MELLGYTDNRHSLMFGRAAVVYAAFIVPVKRSKKVALSVVLLRELGTVRNSEVLAESGLVR